MSSDAIILLRQQLDSITVEDAEGLLEYIPLAARLAALGQADSLTKWRELAARFPDFANALAERCREGIWDLEQSFAEDLGLAIIEAQDFYCFAHREGDLLPSHVRTLLTAWEEHAEEVALDEDAEAVLEEFLERFPIPSEDRLVVVDCPVTVLAKAFVAAQTKPRLTIETQWPSVSVVPDVREVSDSPELAGLSAGFPQTLAELPELCAAFPSDRLKRIFERRVEVEVPDVGYVRINRSVSDEWEMVVDVELADGSLPELEMIRLGVLPLIRTADADICRWVASLQSFEHLQRVNMMEQHKVVILFRNGFRLEID